MLIFAIDDERLLLKKLHQSIAEVLPEAQILDFTRASAAMAAMTEEGLRPDLVFLDIRMPGMSGLELAGFMAARDPECRIIFCTGYEQYALDAIRLHIQGYLGYLIKPVSAEAIRRELAYMDEKITQPKLLTVKCFGSFEVMARGEPLSFKRSRAKELLAYLIDRNGAGVTAKQICARLWDDGTNDTKNLNYLYQLFDDLRNTLNQAGAEGILQRKGYSYYLDTSRISCDYYDYLTKGSPKFYGEYMTQYSWAEETCGLLWKK